MATRARNGSARPRGGLDEAAPEPAGRPAATKSPAGQAPRRKQGQGSQTRSGTKKKSNRKPSGKPGTAKGRTAKGRPAPARPPRDPVVILVRWTGKMIVAAWMLVAGAVGFAARAVGRGARDLDPHHRRDGVGLLTLGAAIVLAAALWFRMQVLEACEIATDDKKVERPFVDIDERRDLFPRFRVAYHECQA